MILDDLFESPKKRGRTEPPEADYGDEYQAMVKRVGQRAKQGPLKTVWDPEKRVYKNVPREQPTEDEEQLDELYFLGSKCTTDCSGHRAGYDWSSKRGDIDSASWSNSFNNGAHLRATGN